MKKISNEKQREIRKSYENHFSGKNWGSWNISNMPAVGVGFQMLQYTNDQGRVCDVIKFDEPVQLEGLRRAHTTFHFKFKPNHNTTAWPTFNEGPTMRTCHDCGENFPVYSEHWATSRKCVKCAEQKPVRFKNWLSHQKRHGELGLQWAKKMGKYTFGISDENLIESLYNEIF